MAVLAESEKRIFQRMIIDKPVTISCKNGVIAGICQDLSANGMSVEVEQNKIATGDEVNVSLSASDARVPPLEATAKVVRIVSAAGDNEVIGLEFITVS